MQMGKYFVLILQVNGVVADMNVPDANPNICKLTEQTA